MKTANKLVAAVMAVCLLSPAPAWAAKQNDKQEAGFKQSRLQQQLDYTGKGIQPLFPYSLTKQKTKLQGWDKQSAEYKNAKKKQINVEKMPGEMEDILKKAHDIFPDLKEMKVTEAAILFEDGERPELWGFEFEKGDRQKEKFARARLTLEPKEGIVISYYFYDEEWKYDKPVTEKQAKEDAAKFLKKVLGDSASQYKATNVHLYGNDDDEDDDDDDDEVEKSAFVNFSRLINKIPYANDGIHIHIDGEGRVRNYDCDWRSLYIDESAFPDPKDAIKQKDAKNAYMKLEEMSLLYRNKQLVEIDYDKEEQKTKPVLKYVPSYYGNMDAITGKEAEDLDGSHREPSEKIELAPEGIELKAASREEAEKMLKDVFAIDVTGWDFDQYPDEDDEDERDYVRYYWYNEGKDSEQEIALTIDKDSKQVIGFWKDEYMDDDKEEEVKVSEKEAKKIAIDTLQKYLPADMKEGALIMESSPNSIDLPDWVDEDELPKYWLNSDYHFVLHELHQGVAIEDSVSWVRIDSATGNILSLGFNRNEKDTKLPDNTKTVSPDKAEEAYVNNLDFELVYVWPEIYDQKAPNPLLVYTANSRAYGYIDAFTGKLVKIKEKNEK